MSDKKFLPRVICGFPGVGKSTMVKHGDGHILDSDSSTFGKNGFPQNYIDHIQKKTAEGYTILASSHAEVRAALTAAGIPFVLVFPRIYCRREYLGRYADRKSPEGFIKLVDTNWISWINGCEDEPGTALKYRLGALDFMPSLDQMASHFNVSLEPSPLDSLEQTSDGSL